MKVFCIFTENKEHDYDRKEIYTGGYPGAGAGRGICVRQQSERNAQRRGGPRRIREVRGRLGSGHRPSGTELRHTDHAGRRGDHQLTFLVTRIGCGIAGFRDEEIAPLFKDAAGMANVILPRTFADILSR